jgi:hypothetical protein
MSMTPTTLPTKPVENWEAVRDEWLAILEQFFTDVEAWAKKQDWATLRTPKNLTETRIGSYTSCRLLVHMIEGRLVFDPMARFVSGGDGLIDWYVLPSYDSSFLVREGNVWQLYAGGPQSEGTTWSEDVFVKTAREMVKRA